MEARQGKEIKKRERFFLFWFGTNFPSFLSLLSTTSDEFDSVSLFSNNSVITNISHGSLKRKNRGYLDNLSDEELQQLQRRYKLTRPRIIKSDFRRNFPAIWVNVFNSCSYDYLMRHINTFYDPDVMMQQRDLRPRKFHGTSYIIL